MTSIKTYSRHNCGRKHKTRRSLAQCMFTRAEWVAGEGEYATLARCRVLTAELHTTLEKAQAAMRLIDSTGCGGRCHNDHELIRLADPANALSWE